jgi:hypothetical protein
MMNCFFSTEYKNRSDLFENLKIWEHEEYREMQGKYPVIFLSFAGVKEQNFKSAVRGICRKINELYINSAFLMESVELLEIEKRNFEKYMEKIDADEVAYALNALCGYLKKNFKKNVIILLDE